MTAVRLAAHRFCFIINDLYLHYGMNRNYCMNEKIYSAHREIVKGLPFMIRDLEITAF